jgi:hypothetical protein
MESEFDGFVEQFCNVADCSTQIASLQSRTIRLSLRVGENRRVTAYDAADWHDLFVAAAGAAAALDGLLFVAISINIKHILDNPGLPRLAVRAIILLLALLLMSLLALAPGQPRFVLGIEVGIVGVVLSAATLTGVIRGHLPVRNWRWTAPTLVISLVTTVPMIVLGASVAVGAGGGLYWGLGELVLGFAGSIYYAWVLLIEILR